MNGGGSNLSFQWCQKVDGDRMYELLFEFPWPSGFSSGQSWITGHSIEFENPTQLILSHSGRLPTCSPTWASFIVKLRSPESSRPLLRDTATQEVWPLNQTRSPTLLWIRWQLHRLQSKIYIDWGLKSSNWLVYQHCSSMPLLRRN